MSESEMVGVRTGELGALGSDLRRSADAVRDEAERVAGHLFGIGGDEAGRNYAQEGVAVRQGLERVSGWLTTWSAATTATADALGASIVAYTETDRRRAAETDRM